MISFTKKQQTQNLNTKKWQRQSYDNVPQDHLKLPQKTTINEMRKKDTRKHVHWKHQFRINNKVILRLYRIVASLLYNYMLILIDIIVWLQQNGWIIYVHTICNTVISVRGYCRLLTITKYTVHSTYINGSIIYYRFGYSCFFIRSSFWKLS